MQAMSGSIFAELGISEFPERVSAVAAAANGGDAGGEPVSIAMQALTDAAGTLPEATTPVARGRVVVTAAEALLRDGHPSLALAIADSLPKAFHDKRPVVLLRLSALAKLDDPDRLRSEVDHASGLFPDNDVIRPLLQSLSRSGKPASALEEFSETWGALPPTIGAALAGLDPKKTLDLYPDHRAQPLHALRDDGTSFDSFVADLRWGALAARLVNELRRLPYHRKDAAADDVNANNIAGLAQQAREVIRDPDTTPLQKSISEGRSIVVASAHASVNLSLPMEPFVALGNTVVRISNQGGGQGRGEVEQLRVQGDDAHMEFLKLVKRVRKNQLTIVVYPDGGKSGDIVEVEVLGQKIGLGPGAELLAWQGKADVFFAHAIWTGQVFDVGLIPGPRAIDFESREAFSKAFFEFYAEQLTAIALGPAQNIGSGGGFIPILCRAPVREAPVAPAVTASPRLTATTSFQAGMPQLDIHTIAEEWALTTAAELHWTSLSKSLGVPPSRWLDSRGDRMYSAIVYLTTQFDLDNPVLEDDIVQVESTIEAIRKPHSLSHTSFRVAGQSRLDIQLLSTFVKRVEKGSNKKFSKVRDVWTEPDFNEEMVDALLEHHHHKKEVASGGDIAYSTKISRIPDFNNADLMYFRNYIRYARTAEWAEMRGREVRLPKRREAFYYGNVGDGDQLDVRVLAKDDSLQTCHHMEDGTRIFLSQAQTQPVTLTIK